MKLLFFKKWKVTASLQLECVSVKGIIQRSEIAQLLRINFQYS
jgi:hypothetical protein